MCKNCLYRKNCQFLAKHKNAVVENCTAFKSEVEYIANIKSEAIKEFADKLKEIAGSSVAVNNGQEIYETKCYNIMAYKLDDLVKEMRCGE